VRTSGVKRVLIVERDSLLRALIGEWLAAAGVQPVYARADAAPMAPGDVDAIVVDVESPRQAHDVLLAWRQAYPKAAIIAASGRFLGTCAANDAVACRLGATKILAKPFTRNELWAALSLDENPTSSLTRQPD
jgi:DNA-binding response OmpR family regulator